MLAEGMETLHIRLAPGHNWPFWKDVPESSLSAPGSRSWREGARATHRTTPAKSAGEGVQQGRLQKPLGSRDPVVAACVEWVPLGDVDGLRRIWADWLPHPKAEGSLAHVTSAEPPLSATSWGRVVFHLYL